MPNAWSLLLAVIIAMFCILKFRLASIAVFWRIISPRFMRGKRQLDFAHVHIFTTILPPMPIHFLPRNTQALSKSVRFLPVTMFRS